jgi:hypothetical protein
MNAWTDNNKITMFKKKIKNKKKKKKKKPEKYNRMEIIPL